MQSAWQTVPGHHLQTAWHFYLHLLFPLPSLSHSLVHLSFFFTYYLATFIDIFFAIFATWQTELVVVAAAAAANCLCQLLLLLLLLNLLGSWRTELPARFAIAQNKRIIHVCA